MLNYNRRTFEKFMQNIKKKYKKWFNINKKMHYWNQKSKDANIENEKRVGIYEVEFYSLVRVLFALCFYLTFISFCRFNDVSNLS